MNLICNNSSEYLFYLLGIAGEIPFGQRESRLPYKERSIKSARAELIEKGIAKAHKSEDGILSLRLKGSSGEQALAEASPLLSEHAKKLCVYSTTKDETIKRRYRGEFIACLLNQGIPVDGFLPIRQSNILGRNERLSLRNPSETESLLSAVVEEYKYNTKMFLTSKIVKALISEYKISYAGTDVNKSTSSGLLSTPNGMYRVYTPSTNSFRYTRKTETMAMRLEHRMFGQIGEGNHKNGFCHDALYVLPFEDEITRVYTNSERNEKLFFTNVYIIPYSDTLANFIELICIDNWEQKLEGLFKNLKSAENCKVYLGLSCNIKKILTWRPNDKVNPVFIIHPWQEKAIKKLFSKRIENIEDKIEIIEPSMFKQIVEHIKV